MRATRNETCEEAILFVREEILSVFGRPCVLVTDNGPAFKATAFGDFLRENSVMWRPLSAYAPEANGRAERMVGTMKRAIAKVAWSSKSDWDDKISRIVSFYRAWKGRGGLSPFWLMFGKEPTWNVGDVPLLDVGPGRMSDDASAVELVEVAAMRVERETRGFLADVAELQSRWYDAGDQVLLRKTREKRSLEPKWLVAWDVRGDCSQAVCVPS